MSPPEQPARPMESQMAHTTTVTDNDTDLLDDAWLAEPRQRSKWRRVLALSLAASVVFLAGIEVQKEYGTQSAAAGRTGALTAGRPSGLPGARSGAGAGTGAAAGTADSSTADSSTAVIGTVVAINGDVWTVEDLGGTKHRITVSSARVDREEQIDATAVELGDTVDITGAEDQGGDLTASAVTVR